MLENITEKKSHTGQSRYGRAEFSCKKYGNLIPQSLFSVSGYIAVLYYSIRVCATALDC